MRREMRVPVTPQAKEVDESKNTVEGLSKTSKLRVAIGIATRGRPAILQETLQDLRRQHRAPDTVTVAYADPEDIGNLQKLFPEATFVQSAPGLTLQRNAILRALQVEDVVTFLDDDFYLEPSYIKIIEEVFATHPDVVVATGNVLADGINSAGLSYADAEAILKCGQSGLNSNHLYDVFNAYGCNMSLRLPTIREHHLTFDEALPLYGWYEDVDFSRQLSSYGRIVKVTAAHGVHLGVKSGRQSGLRLGYSQIANPVYLAKKRSVPWSYAIASMTSRSVKNAVMCLSPEPFVDRKGRVRGNMRALRDLLKRNLHPMHILDL